MRKAILLLMMSAAFLTGCSKAGGVSDGVTLYWNNGAIEFEKGKDSGATYYSGREAEITQGQGGSTYEITLDNATDVTNITCNTKGILEENMDRYKDAYYYQTEQGRGVVVAIDRGNDKWSVCEVMEQRTPVNATVAFCYDYMENITLTEGAVYCDFGTFVAGNETDTMSVTKEGVDIFGLCKITKGEPTATAQPYTHTQGKKTFELKHEVDGSNNKYYYDGYVISVVSGLSLGEYITFK